MSRISGEAMPWMSSGFEDAQPIARTSLDHAPPLRARSSGRRCRSRAGQQQPAPGAEAVWAARGGGDGWDGVCAASARGIARAARRRCGGRQARTERRRSFGCRPPLRLRRRSATWRFGSPSRRADPNRYSTLNAGNPHRYRQYRPSMDIKATILYHMAHSRRCDAQPRNRRRRHNHKCRMAEHASTRRLIIV